MQKLCPSPSVKNLGKYFQVLPTSYFWNLGSFQMFTGSTVKIKYIYQVLSKGGFQCSPGSFEIHWVRQYLINFMGLVGRVNTTVYKTEPIFTGHGHGKLS